MKSKFHKILSMALATVSIGAAFALSSCGGKQYKGDDTTGYVSEAAVSSNGGFAVQKGDYIYFINGMESHEAENKYGEVVKGALMRIHQNDLAQGNYDAAITIVPSVLSTQDFNGGVFIYGDYVYYATPTTDKNIKTGTVESGWLDFKRAKLDGSAAPEEYFFRVEQNNTMYRFVQENGVVYCLYEEDGALKSYDTTNRVDRTLVVGADGYFYDTVNAESGDVYYTMGVSAYEEGYTYKYNQIYRVNAAASATVNKVENGKASYTVAGGKTYSFDVETMEEENATAKENKQDPVYDLKDYATYPYVNLGTLVLDGRGTDSNATQYNAAETAQAKPTTLSGFTYAITMQTNGGLYFTKSDASSEMATSPLYYLTKAQTSESTWNAYTSNSALNVVAPNGAALSQALFTVVDNQHVYYYVEENTLYKVVNGETITMQKTGATGATLWKVEGNYLYYIQTAAEGENGSKLTRINVNGTQQQYNVAGLLDSEDEALMEYKAIAVECAQINSSWFLPEIFGEVMLYSNEQAIGEVSYNYVAATNLGASQAALNQKNEEYKEARKAIDECTDEQTQKALEYYFQTGERTAFDTWASLYTDTQKEDFEAFVKAVTVDKTQALQSAFFAQIGEVKSEDAEAIATTWNDLLEIKDETEEETESSFPVWAIVLISVGGALLVGGAAFVIVWQSKKRKKQAIIDATVNAYKRPKIDTTDDKSIDVYADDAEVVETAEEAPAETAETNE